MFMNCLYLLVFLLTVTVISAEVTVCGPNNCTYNAEKDLYFCNEVTGKEISIPCGPYAPDSTSGLVFTYKNRTADSVIVLQENTEECLRIVLTAFDNSTVITCTPSITRKVYYYVLLVKYSPRLLGNAEILKYPALQYSYDLKCPLRANPSPNCSWSLCVNSTTHEKLELKTNVVWAIHDDSCTLRIATFTSTYFFIRYDCTASNEYGTANTSLTIPQPNNSSFCQATEILSITASHDLHNHNIEVEKGTNLTLTCNIHGVLGADQEEHWEFIPDEEESDAESYDSDSSQFELSTCFRISKLILLEISLNQSGNYTCLYINSLNDTVHVGVTDGVMDEANGQSDVVPIVTGSITGTVVLFIVIVIVIIVIVFWKIGRSKWKFTYLYHMEYEGKEEYDVFLSFAEEDREAAELLVKEPLEQCGYLVCWHHEAFLPGYTIEDNMEMHIYKSRFTVALISEAFLASEFCLTELNISNRKMHETSRNNLVPVIVDQECDIPSDLLRITYVSINDIALIDRLRTRIGDPLCNDEKEEGHVYYHTE